MNHREDEKLKAALKQALPPMADVELGRDLWPQMLRKLGEQAIRVPWWDWTLAALVASSFFFFPKAIPVFLYLF